MRRYWKRLKKHPGVPTACVLTVTFCLAGISRDDASLSQGAVIGLIASAPFWVIVLWTARTQPIAE